jgi:hypothetical protein
MSDSRNSQYILITDLDNTAVSFQKVDPTRYSKVYPKQLSPQLLEFMCRDLSADADTEPKSSPVWYEAFFACSHRIIQDKYADLVKFSRHFDEAFHTSNFYLNQFEHIHQLRLSGILSVQERKEMLSRLDEYLKECFDCTEADPDDHFIVRIVANLEEATKIKCLGVSTPEDRKGECGVGYKILLKPFELELMKKRTSHQEMDAKTRTIKDVTDYPSLDEMPKHYRSMSVSPLGYDHNSKNKQLLSIVKYIKKHKLFDPKKTYYLDFVDDLEKIRASALAMNPATLPNNMILRVYKANAYVPSQKVTFVGLVKGTQPVVADVVLAASPFTLLSPKHQAAEQLKPEESESISATLSVSV